ncbi:MAG: hypothetical protein JJE13_13095 [Thermoleophilia bacterium]|nr:hypothetical protein [Thermoleophilia bacterium]
MNEEELERQLKKLPIENADQAEDRAWLAVKASYESREREGLRSGSRSTSRRLGPQIVAALIALVAGVFVISPAGASVRDWVGDALTDTAPRPSSALTSLPSGGQLLVESPKGSWAVDGNGSQRLLGDYVDPTWSPHGRFIAAVDDHQLVALEPGGDVRWAITLPDRPTLPSWNSPDGFRIAYLEGSDLRVVAGDGTGDRPLAEDVSSVQPAWRAGPAHTLAFASSPDRVTAIRADTGATEFSRAIRGRITGLKWTDAGDLVVWSPRGAQLLDAKGRSIWSLDPPEGSSIVDVAAAPGSESDFAVLESGRRSTLVLAGPKAKRKVLFKAPGRLAQPTWSPGGKWLMVAWPNADQWIFLNRDQPSRIKAFTGIAEQFSPGATSAAAFPRVAGWCCSRDP